MFPQARGHGDAPPPLQGGYGELAADLLAAADAHGATRALGVSLGAATLLRLLSLHPDRFERVVLFLPAALDGPRPDVDVRAWSADDPDAVVAAVRAQLPGDLTGPEVDAYVAARTAFVLLSDLPPLLAGLRDDVPVTDPGLLAGVTAEVLVLAQRDDPLHPVRVAEDVAAALPHARLHVFDRPGVLFRERARLRELVVAQLR